MTEKTYIPDALTGSVLAAKRNAPLLLVNPTYLPTETLQLARARDFSSISVLGWYFCCTNRYRY
ncbi:cell wall-binding repeat-containing protein [Sutcliffiella horikoshii]|uniref:cell wall-binding repeat-containing protein n=1 Tax=Sutcliffiella horikoshii TaxID=79883 RepID=UPI001CBC0919|nr:cell wall-binding repeat-containing protein [Sutcliffiella horikoshii]UAL47037.1 cell wall-binding repeat-containing protein [Sutcliffiella horikoshii]